MKHDYANQTVGVEWKEQSELFPDDQSRFTYDHWVLATTHVRNPADTRIESIHEIGIEKPGSRIHSKAKTIIQSDADFFHISIVLDIERDGAPFASKTWSKTFPRRCAEPPDPFFPLGA